MTMPLPSSKIRVAYAEDHVAMRESIAFYLQETSPIEVIIEACNGKELLEKIRQSTVKPDICILDINMPGMNGFETLAKLKSTKLDLKILVLSTFTDDIYVVRMIRGGVNGYLSKSCSFEEVKQALFALHEKGYYYSDFYMSKSAAAARDENYRFPEFTEKELQLLKYSCSNKTYAEISVAMNCTVKSVQGYRESLFRKLKVNSRVGLALFAVRSGMVPIDRETSCDLPALP